MKNCLFVFALITYACFSWGQAAKSPAPTDPSIKVMMAKIPTIKLSKTLTTQVVKGAQKIDLAVVESSSFKGSKKLEDGQIVGAIVTTGLEKLPNGKHYIYVAKVGTQWKAFAFSGNKIRLISENVEIRNTQAGAEKPTASLEPTTKLKVCAYTGCSLVTVKW